MCHKRNYYLTESLTPKLMCRHRGSDTSYTHNLTALSRINCNELYDEQFSFRKYHVNLLISLQMVRIINGPNTFSLGGTQKPPAIFSFRFSLRFYFEFFVLFGCLSKKIVSLYFTVFPPPPTT